MQPHVDHSGDAARDVGGSRRLHHIDPREQLGRDVLQVHEPARRGEYLAPVEQRLDVGQTANEQLVRFGGVAAYLHAGDVLQRFDHVVVGQLADVLGDDRVLDLIRHLLQVERRPDALAHAGDHDLLQLVGLPCGLGRCLSVAQIGADRRDEAGGRARQSIS